MNLKNLKKHSHFFIITIIIIIIVIFIIIVVIILNQANFQSLCSVLKAYTLCLRSWRSVEPQ